MDQAEKDRITEEWRKRCMPPRWLTFEFAAGWTAIMLAFALLIFGGR